MKKARLILLFAFILTLTLALAGCKKESSIESVYLKDHDPSSVIEISVGEFDYGAYKLVVSYNTGSTEELPLTEDMIAEADLFKMYQEGEHDITVLHEGHTYVFKVAVKRSTFSDIAFPENNVFTYNGKAHTVELEGDIPASAVITYPSGNSFVNAGTYDVYAIISCDGYVTERRSTTVRIERATYDMSNVKFDAKEYVYDGRSHSVTVSGKLPEGVSAPIYSIEEKSTSSAIEVGVYEVKARFISSDPNYEPIPDMFTTLTITPAEHKIGTIDFVFKDENGKTVYGNKRVYDGKSVSFDINDYSKLTGVDSVSFTVHDKDGKLISESNKKTNIINAGEYKITASFSLADSKNYKPIDPITCYFTVEKTDYVLEGITFDPDSFIYDGGEHSIKISGILPSDVDVTYEYYLDGRLVTKDGAPVNAVVDAGRYTVKAIFTHTDVNRNEIESLSEILKIEKVRLDITRVGFSIAPSTEYDGEAHEPGILTWKEINMTDYDILSYGEVRRYKLDSSGRYVPMADGERAVVVGSYRYYVTVSIAPEYQNNYTLRNGSNDQDLSVDFVICKKSLIVPDVTFTGAESKVYNGEAGTVTFTCNADANYVTVESGYYVKSGDGYTAISEAPVNAGTYRFTVTVSVKDPLHSEFIGGETVIEHVFDFVIEKFIIDVDALFAERDYEYTGGDILGKILYTDIDYSIRQYLGSIQPEIVYRDYGYGFQDTYSFSAEDVGRYKVLLTLDIRSEYSANVTFKYRGAIWGSSVWFTFTFNIVESQNA